MSVNLATLSLAILSRRERREEKREARQEQSKAQMKKYCFWLFCPNFWADRGSSKNNVEQCGTKQKEFCFSKVLEQEINFGEQQRQKVTEKSVLSHPIQRL